MGAHYIQKQIEQAEVEIDAVRTAASNGDDDVQGRLDHLKESIRSIKATASILIADRDAWVKRCDDLEKRLHNLEEELDAYKKKTDERLEFLQKENKERKKEHEDDASNISILTKRCDRADNCLRQISRALSEYFSDD